MAILVVILQFWLAARLCTIAAPSQLSADRVPVNSAITDFTQTKHRLGLCLKISRARGLSLYNDPFHKTRNKHSETVILLMLILCADIETNPDPRTALAEIFPCTYCDLPVNYGEKALCYDECSVWLHKSCLCMKTTAYDKLELDADTNWYCPQCRTENSTLYYSYEYTVATQNSFSVLSSIPEDDVFASPTNSHPIAQSSPVGTHTVPKATSINSSLGSTSSTDTGASSKSTQDLPHKRRNWRTLVVNINGIRGKIACIENLIDHTKPDVIMISEDILGEADPLHSFVEHITKATNECIPRATTIPKKSNPWFDEDCREALKVRRAPEKRVRHSPELRGETISAFRRSQAKARWLFNQKKRQSWAEYVSKLSAKTPIKHVWDRVRKISGKNICPP